MKYTSYLSMLILLLLSLVSNKIIAQDLMARQAPIDKQLKAIDSVSLHRILKEEMKQSISDIYTSWNTNVINPYHKEDRPSTYKIDLRDFSMPTPSRMITSNYGYRRAFRRMHHGLDIKVYIGDTIYAAFSGKVRIVDYNRGGYGYYIVIRHPNGLETLYGHLSKQIVKTGEYVKSGQPIGLGGNTGRSTGSHLHFETLFMGKDINPALLFDFTQQDVTGDYFVFNENGNYKTESSNKMIASVAKEELMKRNDDVNANKGVANEGNYSIHKVKRGETLSSIAKKHGTTIDNLCSKNDLNKRSKLSIGQILKY